MTVMPSRSSGRLTAGGTKVVDISMGVDGDGFVALLDERAHGLGD